MPALSEIQLVQCHKKGVALNSAWITYAHPELKSQWQALKQQSPLEALTKGAAATADDEGDILQKFSQALTEPSKIWRARAELEKQLKANILGYIKNGHLHGFGFEPPRKLASIPVAIPKEAWAGKCDWAAGTLHYRGLNFADVHLTTNRLRNEILERGHVDTPETRAPGRPSVAPAIEAAFHALLKTGDIDPAASQMSHYPKVRKWIELNHPDVPVSPAHMSDKTIQKYFSKLFNALKESPNYKLIGGLEIFLEIEN